jgi:hypothetical protein
MKPTDKQVPDWLLERLAAGDLPEARANELRDRLRAQNEEHRLSALAASDADILAALPPERALPEIQRRAAREQRRVPRNIRSWWALSSATAGVAALAMILAVREHKGSRMQGPVSESERGESIGIKGDLKPVLRIYRKSAAGAEALRPDAKVRQGDTLQIRYVAAGRRYGVIASVDARGAVTLHLPENPGTAVALERDGERALPHAYELDDSPGFERFVFVTSDAPFDSADVARALAIGGTLPAPLASFDLILKKGKP